MSDYIDRQAAIEEFDGVKVDVTYCTDYALGYNDGIDFVISKLSVLPSAQKKGEWIDIECNSVMCTECNYICDVAAKFLYSFCPNCGADMRKKEEIKTMDCFWCGGKDTMEYTTSKYNGHKRGHCTKCGMQFFE